MRHATPLRRDKRVLHLERNARGESDLTKKETSKNTSPTPSPSIGQYGILQVHASSNIYSRVARYNVIVPDGPHFGATDHAQTRSQRSIESMVIVPMFRPLLTARGCLALSTTCRRAPLVCLSAAPKAKVRNQARSFACLADCRVRRCFGFRCCLVLLGQMVRDPPDLSLTLACALVDIRQPSSRKHPHVQR